MTCIANCLQMSTPQPIKDRPLLPRSPLATKCKTSPGNRWSILARMKRCKSEPNLSLQLRHNKKHYDFLNGKTMTDTMRV